MNSTANGPEDEVVGLDPDLGVDDQPGQEVRATDPSAQGSDSRPSAEEGEDPELPLGEDPIIGGQPDLPAGEDPVGGERPPVDDATASDDADADAGEHSDEPPVDGSRGADPGHPSQAEGEDPGDDADVDVQPAEGHPSQAEG